MLYATKNFDQSGSILDWSALGFFTQMATVLEYETALFDQTGSVGDYVSWSQVGSVLAPQQAVCWFGQSGEILSPETVILPQLGSVEEPPQEDEELFDQTGSVNDNGISEFLQRASIYAQVDYMIRQECLVNE